MTMLRLFGIIALAALLAAQAVPVLAGFEGGDTPNWGPTGAEKSNNQGKADSGATANADPPNSPNDAAVDHRR